MGAPHVEIVAHQVMVCGGGPWGMRAGPQELDLCPNGRSPGLGSRLVGKHPWVQSLVLQNKIEVQERSLSDFLQHFIFIYLFVLRIESRVTLLLSYI